MRRQAGRWSLLFSPLPSGRERSSKRSARKVGHGLVGDNPPYHCPVFVLTHHARAPLEMQGGTVFHFVTDGIYEACYKRCRQRLSLNTNSSIANLPVTSR